MDAQFEYLIRIALRVRLQAYAPYSKFAVGAAVQCKSAAVFIGSNIENISHGLTICAERIGMGSAVAAGQRELVTIAVVADTIEPIVPCGACRQFLAGFFPDLIIVSATVEGGPQGREPFSSASGPEARNSKKCSHSLIGSTS